MKLVLASASPRRKELLELLGYDFSVEAANVDEDLLPKENPIDYVLRVSRDKCQAVVSNNINHVVLAADTSVVLGNAVLGKPSDIPESIRMLSLLSSRRHSVLTAFAIYNPKTKEIKAEIVESFVVFRVLDQAEIESYSESKEGFDKAGGYGFQNSAMKFISSIEGSPSNIVGLPLVEVKLSLDEILCQQ